MVEVLSFPGLWDFQKPQQVRDEEMAVVAELAGLPYTLR
jgi:hypothetical protein